MPRTSKLQSRHDIFESVRSVGLRLPHVEAATKYDGSPLLKLGGCFMAGLATHRSAEPGTLVVRADFEDRDRLLADAPDTYYVTPHYERHPVILVRLHQLDWDALHDLLTVSWQLTKSKAGKGSRRHPDGTRRSPAR